MKAKLESIQNQSGWVGVGYGVWGEGWWVKYTVMSHSENSFRTDSHILLSAQRMIVRLIELLGTSCVTEILIACRLRVQGPILLRGFN